MHFFGAGANWTMRTRAVVHTGIANLYISRWFGLAFLILLAILPAQSHAQGLAGRVLDAETNIPVRGALVVLKDLAGITVGQATSDQRGYFAILVGQQGRFNISVEMLGYDAGGETEISFSNTDVLAADLVITPAPVVLDDLTVTGEAEEVLTYMQKTGYYERKAQGFGDYIEADEHTREHMLLATDLVRRLPGLSTRDGVVRTARGAIRGAFSRTLAEQGQVRQGIRVAESGGEFQSCPLKIVVDGMDMGIDLDFVTSRIEILAMEVYKGFASVPARWQHTVSRGSRDKQGNPTSTCGLILVWTRHG